jgi:hypothetical protein
LWDGADIAGVTVNDPVIQIHAFIAKQCNCPIGDFKLVFRNDITKFFNYEPQPDYMPQ